MLRDAALKAACPHIYRLRFPFNFHTLGLTHAGPMHVQNMHAQLLLTTWLTLPPSPEVEPDIIGCVCSLCNKEMKWGATCRKGSLWGGSERWPRSTDVLCLSAWSHLNEASVWIPALSASLWRWFRLPRPWITTTTTTSLKMLLAPNQGCCFTSNTALSCRCVGGQQMPIHRLCTVGEGGCNKCSHS